MPCMNWAFERSGGGPAADKQIKSEVERLRNQASGHDRAVCGGGDEEYSQVNRCGPGTSPGSRVLRVGGDVHVESHPIWPDCATAPAMRYVGCCGGWLDEAYPVVRGGRMVPWDAGLPRGADLGLHRSVAAGRPGEISGESHPGGRRISLHRINRLQEETPGAGAEMVTIPAGVRNRHPGRLGRLLKAERACLPARRRSLQYWMGLRDYPSFTVDKTKLWEIDAAMLMTRAGWRAGARNRRGTGQDNEYPVFVAGHPAVRDCRAKMHIGPRRWRIGTGTSRACASIPAHCADYPTPGGDVSEADLAVAFGWAPYLVRDSCAHQSLCGICARSACS